ncbi:MAG: efflux RND transporter permease subunit [Limnochordia bacterium]|jgi:HAE1 family hydrophobic/amphiphilic exporter-1
MNISRFAVHRPVTTAMIYIAVTLLGLFALGRLAIDLIPELAFPSLSITTSYSGVAPEEIESLITIPIEQAVSTVSGVIGMDSLSREGSSRVTLRFPWGTDLEAVTNEVRASVERARSRLPSEASAPWVGRFDPSQMPIMTLGLSGELDLAELRRLAAEEITYYLERIDGVAAVTVQGGRSREVRVELDQARLQAYGLTIEQIVQAIRAENFNVPAGRIVVGQSQFSLRTLGELRAVEELEAILVANRDGVSIRLGDVAQVRPVTEDAGAIVRVDGMPGVTISIQKQSGANTVRVADAVRQTVDELSLRYPNLRIRPLNDSSRFIRQAVNNVMRAGIIGGLLAALILLFFLGSLRSTLIISIAIPVSIITSFILIDWAGMTLNIMSLGGLALGIGMLVDNSIIVLENIYRHLREGRAPKEAAVDGSGEMAMAVIASTLTTLAVFLPLMYLTGMTGILFRQLSLMVAFSLTCSLTVALTLVPFLCSRLLKAGRNARHLDLVLAGLEEAYGHVLASAVRRPGVVIFTACLLILFSLGLIPYLGSEFSPTTDEGEFSISFSLPPGTLLGTTDEMVRRVEQLVREMVPELQYINARAGSGGGQGGGMGFVNVTLVPRNQRARSTQEIIAEVREKLADIPGPTFRVRAQSSFAERLAAGSLGGSSERITINVQGQDLDLVRAAAEDLREIVSQVPGVVNAGLSREETQPEFVLRVDRHRASEFGLTTSQVANAVQAAVQGRVATQLHVNGQEYGVRVQLAGADSLSPKEIEVLPVSIGGGAYVPLHTVARLSLQDSPAAIERLNQKRTVRVTASPEGRDLGSVMGDIQAALAGVELPEGVTIHYGGEWEEQQRAFREMLTVLCLAVSLVYIVMACQFESLLDPLIIMFSVPFALVGVVITLLITGTPLTTQALMGLIMLGGIVVNNAIVLVDYINLLRSRGASLDEAVVAGAKTRLRPILMTTGTTCLALVPLALELGEGAEIQAPLARTVIGGLLAATLVTLVLIPTIYRAVHRRGVHRAASAMLVLILLLASPGALAHGAITLEEAFAQALETNHRLLQARWKLAAAESKLRELEGSRGPHLTLDGEWQATEPVQRAGVAFTVQGSLPTTEPISWQLARLAVEGAKGELADEEEVVKLAVLTAYVDVLKSQGAVQVARLVQEQLAALVEQARRRKELGMAGELELRQAQAQYRAGELALARAENRLALARARLAQEMGAPLPEEGELLPIPLDALAVEVDGALDRRWDVAQARLRLRQAELQAKARIPGDRPTLSVSGSLRGDEGSARLAWDTKGRALSLTVQRDLLQYGDRPSGSFQEEGWSVNVGISWPIFDGGEEKERSLQEELDLEQLRSALAQQEVSASLAIQDALLAAEEAEAQVELAHLDWQMAEERLKLVEEGLAIGAETTHGLLEAEIAVERAKQAWQEAQWNALLARARLRRAAGQPVWMEGED